MKFFSRLANNQKLFRRLILIWAVALNTHFVLFLMNHEFLINVGAAGATIATGVIGILTTVISFYQWHRQKDDDSKKGDEQ